jgi:four helix bundle protein
LSISLGSLAELGYTVRFARDLGILSNEEWEKVELERDQAGKILWRLYLSLRPDQS